MSGAAVILYKLPAHSRAGCADIHHKAITQVITPYFASLQDERSPGTGLFR